MLKYARRSLDLTPGFACFEHSNLFKVNGLELCAERRARPRVPARAASDSGGPRVRELSWTPPANPSFLGRGMMGCPIISEAREAWKTRAQWRAWASNQPIRFPGGSRASSSRPGGRERGRARRPPGKKEQRDQSRAGTRRRILPRRMTSRRKPLAKERASTRPLCAPDQKIPRTAASFCGHGRLFAPKSNYELFNCNNFNIRYWSWNYRGCWHQTCPPVVPRERDLNCAHSNCSPFCQRPALLFIVTASLCQDWAICAPAAFLGSGSRFSRLPLRNRTPILRHPWSPWLASIQPSKVDGAEIWMIHRRHWLWPCDSRSYHESPTLVVPLGPCGSRGRLVLRLYLINADLQAKSRRPPFPSPLRGPGEQMRRARQPFCVMY